MEVIHKPGLGGISSPDISRWEAFIRAHPDSTIFQHPCFFQLHNSIADVAAGVFVVVDRRGDISGILAYTIISEGGYKKLFSRRSIIQGGPLVKDNDAFLFQLLLNAYNKEIKKNRAIYTEIRNHRDTTAERRIFERHGFEYSHHLNICIDLTKEENELRMEMHKKRMSNIRRAIKKGVYTRDIKDGREIDEAYNLIKKTYHRVNLPLPSPELFLNAQKYFAEKLKIYGAFSGDKMIGVRAYLLFNRTIYDWYAGSDERYFNLHPNDVLPWHMMLWGKENNFSIYDFGGAGNPSRAYGVRTYKERFGGSTVDRGRYLKIHNRFLYKIGLLAIKYYKYIRHL